MHLVRQCDSDGLLVLVAADTAQFIGLSVEGEACLAIEAKPAETCMMIIAVEDGFCLFIAQNAFYPVEMRCLGCP